MNTHIDPNFMHSVLEGFQGYHFQVFASGRAKITLQHDGTRQAEYYAVRPNRDREAYYKQKKRSSSMLPDHFKVVDRLLEDLSASYVYRVHAKGDNNKTADNAHLVVSQYSSSIWVVMDTILHEWEVEGPVAAFLITGGGARKGQASIFHEFVPTYEHDWQDATFDETLYRRGYRTKARTVAKTKLPEIISSPEPSSGTLPQGGPDSPSPIGHPKDATREPQSGPSPRQLPHEYTDGSYSEPYDEEPDPEGWGMDDDRLEEVFEPCAMVIVGDNHEGEWQEDNRISRPSKVCLPSHDPHMTIGRSTLHSTASLWEQVQG